MSDHEERAEDARIETARSVLRLRARQINSAIRAEASVLDTPPEYVCEGCARYPEFCKCEEDAE